MLSIGIDGDPARKNIETLENDVADSDYQDMEQFISSSPWSHDAVMDQVAAEVDSLIGDPERTGLILDKSSFLKKGKASVGVQRQRSGRAGKIENCQVGVFACLAKADKMALTDLRLFLPESWPADEARCDKARIPAEHRSYQPKWRQALRMVESARRRGMLWLGGSRQSVWRHLRLYQWRGGSRRKIHGRRQLDQQDMDHPARS